MFNFLTQLIDLGEKKFDEWLSIEQKKFPANFNGGSGGREERGGGGG